MRTFEYSSPKIYVLINADYHGEACAILKKELEEKGLPITFDEDPEDGELQDVTLIEPGVIHSHGRKTK